MGKAISVRWTATRPRPCGTPRPAWRASPRTLLEDIDKETVDFRPNYDDSELEPEVLPTRVPNLLINGSSGIAVGMATNIPPHNLTEIIDATIAADPGSAHTAGQDPRNGPRARISQPAALSWAGRASSSTSPRAAAVSSCAQRPPSRRCGKDREADRRHRDSVPGEQVAAASSTPPRW